MFLEGNYAVYFGENQCGKVQVVRQGLYYRFVCRCRITGNVVCRLVAKMELGTENLGIVVPTEDGFGLRTSIPVKRFLSPVTGFVLLPKREALGGTYVPIVPEEPFTYLEKLKEAYLVKKNGTVGAIIPGI